MTDGRKGGITRGAAVALVALLFLGNALNYVDRQVLALLKPTLEAEFGWTDADYAHLGSSFQIAAAGTLLFVGWFVDRLGVRIAYAVAVTVWSAAGMAHALAQTVQQFVTARIVLAAGESVSTPAGLKAAATYLPVRQRNFAIGLINTAPNIGAILTPLLIPPFALAFGWKAAFVVTGALGFLWLAGWWFGTRGLQPVGNVPERARVPWGELLSDRRTWTVIGAKFCTDAVWWFVLFWMPDFFNRQFGLSQGQLGWPIAIIFTLAALGALTSGGLYPILLARGMSVNAARKTSMLFYALVVLAMPLSLQTGNPWLAAVLIGLGLFAHQGFSTNVFGMTADIVPATRVASVIALGAIAGNLSGTGIIEFAGWSLTNGLGYVPMFAICGSAYLVALAFIHLMLPKLQLSAGE
ncbi:major facilitator superfamily MFS_1 [Novosphingobium aromaticivorans DSM 12444]|uniref:Major facilitator superfamily MFS_1 n=1 Tax=Novosphingobium aromaticivorans (strain ATCC 700278 / DSM 12444 / CCUG 56034 / CIP 105152 / NBRC 16084 / F199) TaxID=279238 RepID=Q2G5I9_NOVAD|nr:MFS transporter [Novosphingobium aromaticivorans]ABD26884.1 major facilitator superfamily MFS_1 [Novosphingobium aromaticivorans DSM 12444]SCY44555.1 MFS transporter, ACS family, hexuronate transporter [Novosphingobium aromaticivorans]